MASYIIRPWVRREGGTTVHTDAKSAGASIARREFGASHDSIDYPILGMFAAGLLPGEIVDFDSCVLKRIV